MQRGAAARNQEPENQLGVAQGEAENDGGGLRAVGEASPTNGSLQ